MNFSSSSHSRGKKKIGIIGTGISGLSAAWLLSRHHDVTVYEKDDRLGGHSNTVDVEIDETIVPVDTGFIVYNEKNYPNLVALFSFLGVETKQTDMSFAASLDSGRFEYSGTNATSLFAQPVNFLRPRMWSMLRGIIRFAREAPRDVDSDRVVDMTLGEYLERGRYGASFINDHILPMGAAIWSTPACDMLDYPLAAFVRFFENHGLLTLSNRPVWRTVDGGSREYVKKLSAKLASTVRLNTAVRMVRRAPDRVIVEDRQGDISTYDHVVIATHADQALALLSDADAAERRLLAKFRYERNLAVLHSDVALMPKARRAWSSWNFLSRGRGDERKVSVSYWMNRLQRITEKHPLFVTLNPVQQPKPGSILRSFLYDHPVYDHDAIHAQRLLWNIQGTRRTWFCGSYFGHGFHEDGLQAGLAVAEQLGGFRRPWSLENPSDRIYCTHVADQPGRKGRAA